MRSLVPASFPLIVNSKQTAFRFPGFDLRPNPAKMPKSGDVLAVLGDAAKADPAMSNWGWANSAGISRAIALAYERLAPEAADAPPVPVRARTPKAGARPMGFFAADMTDEQIWTVLKRYGQRKSPVCFVPDGSKTFVFIGHKSGLIGLYVNRSWFDGGPMASATGVETFAEAIRSAHPVDDAASKIGAVVSYANGEREGWDSVPIPGDWEVGVFSHASPSDRYGLEQPVWVYSGSTGKGAFVSTDGSRLSGVAVERGPQGGRAVPFHYDVIPAGKGGELIARRTAGTAYSMCGPAFASATYGEFPRYQEVLPANVRGVAYRVRPEDMEKVKPPAFAMTAFRQGTHTGNIYIVRIATDGSGELWAKYAAEKGVKSQTRFLCNLQSVDGNGGEPDLRMGFTRMNGRKQIVPVQVGMLYEALEMLGPSCIMYIETHRKPHDGDVLISEGGSEAVRYGSTLFPPVILHRPGAFAVLMPTRIDEGEISFDQGAGTAGSVAAEVVTARGLPPAPALPAETLRKAYLLLGRNDKPANVTIFPVLLNGVPETWILASNGRAVLRVPGHLVSAPCASPESAIENAIRLDGAKPFPPSILLPKPDDRDFPALLRSPSFRPLGLPASTNTDVWKVISGADSGAGDVLAAWKGKLVALMGHHGYTIDVGSRDNMIFKLKVAQAAAHTTAPVVFATCHTGETSYFSPFDPNASPEGNGKDTGMVAVGNLILAHAYTGAPTDPTGQLEHLGTPPSVANISTCKQVRSLGSLGVAATLDRFRKHRGQGASVYLNMDGALQASETGGAIAETAPVADIPRDIIRQENINSVPRLLAYALNGLVAFPSATLKGAMEAAGSFAKTVRMRLCFGGKHFALMLHTDDFEAIVMSKTQPAPEGAVPTATGPTTERQNPRPTTVQTILFDRTAWTVKAAQAWLREHGYGGMAADTTDHYHRFRQRDPEAFRRGSFRTIPFGATTGIQAVIGRER